MINDSVVAFLLHETVIEIKFMLKQKVIIMSLFYSNENSHKQNATNITKK